MPKKSLADVPASALTAGLTVVRFDLNAPLDDGQVSDDTRLRAVVPTLETLRDAGARSVLLSHLGRPEGRAVAELSLRPVAERLSELTAAPVTFVPAVSGPEVERAAREVGPGEALLLENTRFLPGETANDPELAASWASLGSVYVNDAFGAAHRAHASTEGVARAVRADGGVAVAGPLMERELRFLGRVMTEPERPFVAVLGGAKISGKIDVVEALLERVDRLVIGGAMANTFFLALGLETGGSLVEDDRVELARELLERAGDRLMLPIDVRVADALTESATVREVERSRVGSDDVIGDIGPMSLGMFAEVLAGARTVVWNGPMGVFEMKNFAAGTVELAEHVAQATSAGALTVVGGGDSAAAVREAGVYDRISHVSTGGGASLEFLAGERLPGVEALSDSED